MLVLTRKLGDKIVIGDNITITVTAVMADGRVRLGVECPRHIRVDRAEVAALRTAPPPDDPEFGAGIPK